MESTDTKKGDDESKRSPLESNLLPIFIFLLFLPVVVTAIAHLIGAFFSVLAEGGLELAVVTMTITLSALVIFLANPMHSLLALIGAFIATMSLFFLVGAEFFATVFLVVYIGAVAILFLFVVMLLPVKSMTVAYPLLVGTPVKRVALTVAMGTYLYGLTKYRSVLEGAAAITCDPSSLDFFVAEQVGGTQLGTILSLYDEYGILFALITLILLIALLGATALASSSRS